jgi:hypothetical protein
MPPEEFSPEAFHAAKAIAVLEERTNTMGREMREMKEQGQRQWDETRASQKEMGVKLDAVLTAMSEARGGWKTVLLVGSMSGTIGAAIAWMVGLFSRGNL